VQLATPETDRAPEPETHATPREQSMPEEETMPPETPSEQPQHPMDLQVAGNIDYVTSPDFNSQEYYNWLSSFTELCKLVPMPLDNDLFAKINQVHKTLFDVLAKPQGILTNKENFHTLMIISQELNMINNEHLNHVMQNLDSANPAGVDAS